MYEHKTSGVSAKVAHPLTLTSFCITLQLLSTKLTMFYCFVCLQRKFERMRGASWYTVTQEWVDPRPYVSPTSCTARIFLLMMLLTFWNHAAALSHRISTLCSSCLPTKYSWRRSSIVTKQSSRRQPEHRTWTWTWMQPADHQRQHSALHLRPWTVHTRAFLYLIHTLTRMLSSHPTRPSACQQLAHLSRQVHCSHPRS